ncbi:hypothetical protein [Natrinema versiforme]|uniref:hypothetical protein n=1 Tax=Natrinema versiforme TaxID=88724 RepID=UPI001267FBC9
MSVFDADDIQVALVSRARVLIDVLTWFDDDRLIAVVDEGGDRSRPESDDLNGAIGRIGRYGGR